jgi:hypothetical protein
MSELSIVEHAIELYGQPISYIGEELRFICPECGKKALYFNSTKGLAHCFVCDYGKGLKALVDLQQPAVAEVKIDYVLHNTVTQKVVELAKLDDVHREYLKDRGVFNPEKYGIGTIPFQIHKILTQYFSQEELIASGYCNNRNGFAPGAALHYRRISIPYWQGSDIVTVKTRINPYSMDDDFSPRYANPKGSRIGDLIWYRDLGDDIIVTEGELKAIVALEFGYAAVAVPGINPKPKALTSLKKIVKKAKRVFIIFDTDLEFKEKKPLLEKVVEINKLIPNSVIAFLPEESEKVDLDSYLIAHSLRDFDDFLEDSWMNRVKLNKYYRSLI